MEKPTVLVIGAGIGGIATAARLARHGYQVTVVEKCGGSGGRCGSLVKDGHHFVTGPTLFLMPEIYDRAFADLGERMEDHLDLRRVDPTYHLHFRDGSSLILTSDLQAMQAQLEAIEPGSFRGFLGYLDEGHRHYELSMAYLVERDFRSLAEYYNPRNLWLFLKLKALIKHYKNIGHYFRDPRLKAAFTFQDMYLGLSPFESSAIFSLLQYSEFAEGVWFPMGGMSRVIEVLVTIAKRWGVQFLFNAPVARIDVNNRRATGVTLSDGRQIKSDIVVANADLPYVYRHLLPGNGKAERFDHKRYSCSAVMFYWGLDKQYRQLGPHHLFFSGNYRHSFDRISKELAVSDDPNFYLHAPRCLDSSLAPEGQDTLMAIVPVGHINDAAPQDWGAIQEQLREVVLERLTEVGLSNLDKHIKFELSFNPTDWKNRFNLAKGATHGLKHDVLQMGYLRPRNRHRRYHNLYFVGASTHPGTGLPTVLISARQVTEHILEDAEADQFTFIPSPVTALSQRGKGSHEEFERSLSPVNHSGK